MSRRIVLSMASLTLVLPLVIGIAHAQPPHGPPPEAFAACEDQETGSRCAFESVHGTLEGVCRTPRGERLVCVPDDHRPPPSR